MNSSLSKLESKVWALWQEGNNIATIALLTNKTILEIISLIQDLTTEVK